MTHIVVKAGIAALVALTSFGATLTGAAAAGPDYGVYVQYHDRDRGPPRDWRGPPPRRDRCSSGFAEEKASRMGLRRARVVDVSRRVVVVEGFDRRGRDRIVFANERGCPVIRR